MCHNPGSNQHEKLLNKIWLAGCRIIRAGTVEQKKIDPIMQKEQDQGDIPKTNKKGGEMFLLRIYNNVFVTQNRIL